MATSARCRSLICGLVALALMFALAAPSAIAQAPPPPQAGQSVALDNAAALLGNGDLEQAKAMVEQLLSGEPALEGDNAKRASKLLRQIDAALVKRQTAKSESLFAEGETLLDAGKLADAREKFQAYLDSGAKIGFWRKRKVRGYLKQIDSQLAAAAEQKEAVAEVGKGSAKKLAAAQTALQEGRLADAKALAGEVQKDKRLAGTDLAQQAARIVAAAETKEAEAAAKAEAQAQAERDRIAAAQRLFTDGMRLYEAGDYAAAKDKLTKAKESGVDMGGFLGGNNRKLEKTLAKIEEQQAQAAKTEATQAETAQAEAETAKAEVAQPVAEAPAAPTEEEAAKEAKKKLKAEMMSLFEDGIDLYELEYYSEARDQLLKVRESGVDLGGFLGSNNRKLNKILAAIDKRLGAERAEPKVAKAEEAKPEPETPAKLAEEEKAKAAQAELKSEMLSQFTDGMVLYENGQLAEARELLTEVQKSGVDLGGFMGANNRRLRRALADIEERTAAKGEAEVAKAEEAKPEQPKPEEPKAEQPKPAEAKPEVGVPAEPTQEAVEAEAARQRKTEMIALFASGMADFEAGDLASAKVKLAKVRESRVDLGGFMGSNNRKLEKTLAKIDEQQAKLAKAEEAKPEAEAPAEPTEEEKARAEAQAKKAQAEQMYRDGVTLYQAGQLDAALEAFREVQQMDVDLGWVKNSRLAKYIKNLPEDIEKAKAEAERQVREDKAVAAYKAAADLYEQGDYKAAKAALKSAAELADDLPGRLRRKLESMTQDADEKIAEQERTKREEQEKKLAREQEALDLYNRAAAALKEKRYGEAKALVNQLRTDYQDTEFVKTH